MSEYIVYCMYMDSKCTDYSSSRIGTYVHGCQAQSYYGRKACSFEMLEMEASVEWKVDRHPNSGVQNGLDLRETWAKELSAELRQS